MTMNIKQFDYKGAAITFQTENGGTMVNATEMAKPFDKKPAEWLRLPSTAAFMEALSCMGKSHTSTIQTVMGSPDSGGGTWMHEDVALEFARWLSPAFAIWCNDRIKELLKFGITATPQTIESIIANPSNAIKLLTALEEERSMRLAEQQRSAQLQAENELKDRRIIAAKNRLEYVAAQADLADRLLNSKSTYSLKEAAKVLMLPFGRNTLFRKLREEKVLMSGDNNRNEPYQEYMSRGYFEYKPIKKDGISEDTGEPYCISVFQTFVTPKGMVWLCKRFEGKNEKFRQAYAKQLELL